MTSLHLFSCSPNSLAVPLPYLYPANLSFNSSGMSLWGKRRKRGVCLSSSAQNSSNSVETKRTGIRTKFSKLHPLCVYEVLEKGRPREILRKSFVFAGPEGTCHSSLPCMRCNDLLYVDFEIEVEDDILAIFRKGEEFNYGVEFVLLIKFIESALDGLAEDALASLAKLATEFPSLIVQSTQGCNFNPGTREYTHGILIRFRSVEAQQIFLDSSEYKQLWGSKMQSISEKTLIPVSGGSSGN